MMLSGAISPEEIAAAIRCLSSPDARDVTGAVLAVEGGMARIDTGGRDARRGTPWSRRWNDEQVAAHFRGPRRRLNRRESAP